MGKKLDKQQYLVHTFPAQYGELQPTSSWNRCRSLEHPCKFQRVSHLGSVTARRYSIERHPNFAALNRGLHLYSAGRPSRWALAHILVTFKVGPCSLIMFWRHWEFWDRDFKREKPSRPRQKVWPSSQSIAVRPHHLCLSQSVSVTTCILITRWKMLTLACCGTVFPWPSVSPSVCHWSRKEGDLCSYVLGRQN